jgi:glyoxylase-like metal-dependent hydrolase (beta-lactamase superfamily II)
LTLQKVSQYLHALDSNKETAMKTKLALTFAVSVSLLTVRILAAQDLGPHFKKIKEGIYVYAQNPADSNATIILTSEGVVLIDSGHRPPDSVAVAEALKKLTSQPVRYLINTEPHTDHTTGHWMFSPPALIVAHAGGDGIDEERPAARAGKKDRRGISEPARDEELSGGHAAYRIPR